MRRYRQYAADHAQLWLAQILSPLILATSLLALYLIAATLPWYNLLASIPFVMALTTTAMIANVRSFARSDASRVALKQTP
jgi:hypothetical protein